MAIKNIILDLGGVVINISYKLTSDAFKKLGVLNFDAIYNQNKQTDLFNDFETGKITDKEFRQKLKKKLDIAEVCDTQFDHAWNAMILNIPQVCLNKIIELKKRGYKVLLFSNINEIHYKRLFEIAFEEHGYTSFGKKYFDAEYYSHLFKKRKPHAESFRAVLTENDFNAEETLFIDDTKGHVAGAKEAGIHAYHLGDGYMMPHYIDQFIIDANAEIAAKEELETKECYQIIYHV